MPCCNVGTAIGNCDPEAKLAGVRYGASVFRMGIGRPGPVSEVSVPDGRMTTRKRFVLENGNSRLVDA